MERRLYRSRKNKMIAGVCGGVAEYLNIDPAIVRLIMALLVFADGLGIILYILALIIIPQNPEQSPGGVEQTEAAVHTEAQNPITIGIILIIIGLVAILWTWGIPWLSIIRPGIFLGILIIIAGIYFLIKGRE